MALQEIPMPQNSFNIYKKFGGILSYEDYNDVNLVLKKTKFDENSVKKEGQYLSQCESFKRLSGIDIYSNVGEFLYSYLSEYEVINDEDLKSKRGHSSDQAVVAETLLLTKNKNYFTYIKYNKHLFS